MIPRFVPMIGLVAGLAPVVAQAQTNIDQGKSPSQIFADDCGVCHKSARGLAKGKNNVALASFLREHYTTSREQAAALAAYVLRAPPEEPKPPSSQQARQSAKPEKPEKQEKPEEGTPATAKLQRPTEEEPRPDDTMAPEPEHLSTTTPGARPSAGRNERQPAATARGRRKEREATPETPAMIVEPGSPEMPNAETAPSSTAAAPAPEAGDNTPVPRDDIPD